MAENNFHGEHFFKKSNKTDNAALVCSCPLKNTHILKKYN